MELVKSFCLATESLITRWGRFPCQRQRQQQKQQHQHQQEDEEEEEGIGQLLLLLGMNVTPPRLAEKKRRRKTRM